MANIQRVCLLLSILYALSTLIVGLSLSPYWKLKDALPTTLRLYISFSLVSVLLLAGTGILILISIVANRARTKIPLVMSLVLVILSVGFLCAANGLLLSTNGHDFSVWIFASLWTSLSVIPFIISTLCEHYIQIQRL